MYVDVEIAQLIRMLDKKKQKAVTSDRFVYAKKLKYATTQLQKIGEKLGKLDIEKEQAVEEEDYDKAHLKKEEMETLRLKTYERLHITTLMEMDGVALKENDREGHSNSSLNKAQADANDMLVPMIGNYVSHDDTAVPALKKGVKTQPSVFPGSNSETGNDLVLGKLTEKDRREASLPIEVFGLTLVEKMYSKSFNLREEAMKELKIYLEKYQKKGKTHSPSDVMRAATFLLYRAIYDKVHSIYTFALNILAFCFKIFIPTHQAPKLDAVYLMDKCLPEIINKLGDTAVRLKNASLDYLTTALSNTESEILHVIYQHILSPIRQNLNVRLAVGKCELIEKLLKQHPPSTSNVLPLSKVMPFLMDALQHPSSSVRGIAERIIVSLYDYDSKNVKKYFPSDSEISKKNIMYHRIFQTFEKVDKQKKNHGWRNENAKQSYLKSYKKKAMQPTQVSYSQNETHNDSLLMKTCIFCGEQKDIFTPEGLDKHYDQDCPMLLRCTNCRQIVEIAGLTEHLLEECEAKNSYQQCPICLEAIPSLNFENHVKVRSCIMAKSSYDANHCPLCHKNFEPGENGWKNHLMEDSGCAFNSRRKSKKDSRKNILRKKSIQSN